MGEILSQEAVADRVRCLQRQGKRVVFTNGCFDLVHVGHIRYLKAARELGDCLVVGLNSDASVRALKGPQRPILPQEERAEILAALSPVDYVTIFEEADPARLIALLQPNVLTKGGDWPRDRIVGRDVVEKAGGQVFSLPLVEGAGSSQIILRIIETYGNGKPSKDSSLDPPKS